MSEKKIVSIGVGKTGNRLLDCLPVREFRRIIASCETVNLSVGQIVCENGCLISQVYFPISASIAQVDTVSNHPSIGLVLIGNEGMLGATQLLGVNIVPLRAVVQCAGTALSMEVRKFRQCFPKGSSFQRKLNRYLYVLFEQIARTTACTRFHDVESRLVRWLLHTHDRSHADQFRLTHQILADMLGVQRSAVTIAAGILQRKGLISYSRGAITVLNRAGLEAVSCECYETVAADQKRLIACS